MIDGMVNARVAGLAVYLDNWAIYDLAEKEPTRRDRFTRAIRMGADLLFSAANLAELGGPTGRSADLVRAFLDDIGPHWFPIELDTIAVVKRELKGVDKERVCVSRDLLMDIVNVHVHQRSSSRIINFSPDEFFRLGAVLDWAGPQRDSLCRGSANMDVALRNRIALHARRWKKEPRSLDKELPPMPFEHDRPASFAFCHLLHGLVKSGHSPRKHDGLDFSHAVMGSAFAHFAALDTKWKERIEELSKPNGLASVYCPSELDKLVDDLETAVLRKAS
jgi:hypothetical protein